MEKWDEEDGADFTSPSRRDLAMIAPMRTPMPEATWERRIGGDIGMDSKGKKGGLLIFCDCGGGYGV